MGYRLLTDDGLNYLRTDEDDGYLLGESPQVWPLRFRFYGSWVGWLFLALAIPA